MLSPTALSLSISNILGTQPLPSLPVSSSFVFCESCGSFHFFDY